MKYARLGKTGLRVSRVCLGAMTYGDPKWRGWVLPEEEGRPLIRQAVEAGINFFDTADMYSLGRSEEILGKALRDFSRREEVVIATKVYHPMGPGPNARGLSRKHILDSIDASLRRLGTDYVDLYQIHRWDYETPIEETLSALDAVVRAGKVRYLGASSMFAWQLAKALYLAEKLGLSRFASMQNHYNLLYREEEREVLPLCREEGLGVIPWSPLARGLLAGKGRGETARAKGDEFAKMLYKDADLAIVERTEELAQRRGVPPAQVGLAWLLHQPGVAAPIIGASKPQHIADAVAALGVKLDEAERARLEEPYRPRPIAGHS
jgi:1-deoxyxylulose-5-phosphate synthase